MTTLHTLIDEVPIEPAALEQFQLECLDYQHCWTQHLINIIHRLPYQNGVLSMRAEIEHSRLLDRKPQGNRHSPSRNFSQLRRRQTWREFYATIDRVLQEQGIYEQVRELNQREPEPDQQQQQSYQLNQRPLSQENHYERICTLIYPAYIRLRELGYNCYPDLTA